MKIAIFSIIVALIISCGTPNIGFLAPQPKEIKEKDQIRKELWGNYQTDDSTMILVSLEQAHPFVSDSAINYNINNKIIIDNKNIINQIEGKIYVNAAYLDSADKNKLLYKHEIDSLILMNIENPKYKYSIDSVDSFYRITFNITSVLFSISDSNIYKDFKGKSYLNKFKKANGYWACTQIESLDKGKIISINSTSRDDISVIERLTELEKDVKNTDANLDPSKRTFKKFLKMKGFEDKIRLKRIQ